MDDSHAVIVPDKEDEEDEEGDTTAMEGSGSQTTAFTQSPVIVQ
jgi:hypothetical protein